MLFFFILTLILSQSSFAQIIVIPESLVPLQKYYEQCNKSGYTCVDKYLQDKILNSSSVRLEHFLNEIDFSRTEFRQNIFLKIKSILSTENIDIEEAQILLNIIDKTLQYENSNPLIRLKKEISETIDYLQNLEPERSEEANYIIFKKMLSKKQYQEYRYKLKYIQATRISPYFEPQNMLENSGLKMPLVQGECDDPLFSKYLENMGSINLALFNNECSTSQNFNSTRAVNFLNEYKNPIIYTAIGVGLIAFFQNYKLEFK